MAVGKCGGTAGIALSHIRARVIPDADFLTSLSVFFPVSPHPWRFAFYNARKRAEFQ